MDELIKVFSDYMPTKMPVECVAVQGIDYPPNCYAYHLPGVSKHLIVFDAEIEEDSKEYGGVYTQLLHDTAIEEYAHALRWEYRIPFVDNHDDMFGVYWARVKRVWERAVKNGDIKEP